ncbi:MAG: 1,4-dihydroxy-2-naphthoate polyprenyltransferase [Deltaproteobacteria bacterium]|nr:1,4-dihydroxy-2-naphthoate polyprenyltransferase [Deltaproteobacteria bacterium]
METRIDHKAITGWQVWLMAARPATLPASIAPVLVGTAAGVHDGAFVLLPFLSALIAAVLIQIGANLANDLFDFEKGADTSQRLGPPRVTQSGLASPQQVRLAMILSFEAAALIGLYLITVGGWPILVVGVLCIAAGLAYTGGPWPLGYHGLGDLFVFLFFGLVAVIGSTYLQTGTLSPTAFAAALPVGCTVTAILVVNNLRDIETDRQAGKRTLAVRLGAPLTRAQYTLLLLLPYVLVTGFVLRGVFPHACWLVWLTLPLAVSLIRTVMRRAEGRALNTVLKGTGQLHLFFGSALAGGLLL